MGRTTENAQSVSCLKFILANPRLLLNNAGVTLPLIAECRNGKITTAVESFWNAVVQGIRGL
jgi:hypothetical protein